MKLIQDRQSVLRHILVVLVLYLVTGALNWALDPRDLGWIGMRLHPYGIVVIVSALRFGRVAGLAAGLMGAAILLAGRIAHEGMPDYFEDLLTWDILDVPAVLIAMGFFIGDVRLQMERRINDLQDEVKDLRDNRGYLRETVKQLEDANLALRERAYGQLSPASKLYKTARALEVLDRDAVCQSVMELVSEHLKAARCTLLMGSDVDLLRPMAWIGWGDDDPENHLEDDGRQEIVRIAINDNRLVSLRERISWSPEGFRHGTDVLLAAPFRVEESGDIGLITVEELPFLQLTEASEQALQMIAEWAGLALDRVHLFEMLRRQAIYDEELGVHSEQHFISSLEREFERAKRMDQKFLLFEMKLHEFDQLPPDRAFYAWKVIGQTLLKTLRGTDLVSRHAEPGRLWVMCTGPGMDLEFMEGRLKRAVEEIVGDVDEGGVSLDIKGTLVPSQFDDHDAALGWFAT